VKTIMISLLALGILALSAGLYRACRSRSSLDVDPHARKEIEKARQK
jgi:hypothetical protein